MNYIVEEPDSFDNSHSLIESKYKNTVVKQKRLFPKDKKLVGYVCAAVTSQYPFIPRAVCEQVAKDLWSAGKDISFSAVYQGAKTLVKKASGLFTTPKKGVCATNTKVSIRKAGVVLKSLKSSASIVPKLPKTGDFSKVQQMSSQIIRAPVAKSLRLRRSNKPKFSGSRKGNVIIEHSEMVGTVVSSGTTLTYNANGYVINPGKSDLFTWLSTIASNYDKYRILDFEAVFVSNQPTSTAGKVGLGIDYDSTDPLPADRSEFYTLTHHVEGAPWDTLSFRPPMQGGVKFVNSHTSTDSKLIDYGQLIVMTDQIVDLNSNIGDVLINYKVELIDPQQASYETLMILYDDNATTFVPSGANPTFTGPSIATVSLALTSATVFELALKEGYYLVSAIAHDSGSGNPTWGAYGVDDITNKFWASSSAKTCTITAVLKANLPTSKLRLTLATVSVANCESVSFAVSRISGAAYKALFAQSNA